MNTVIPQLVTGATAGTPAIQAGGNVAVGTGAGRSSAVPGQAIAEFSNILATLRGDLVQTVNNRVSNPALDQITLSDPTNTQTDVLIDIQTDESGGDTQAASALFSFLQSLPALTEVNTAITNVDQLKQGLTTQLDALKTQNNPENATLIAQLQQALRAVDNIAQQGGVLASELDQLLAQGALTPVAGGETLTQLSQDLAVARPVESKDAGIGGKTPDNPVSAGTATGEQKGQANTVISFQQYQQVNAGANPANVTTNPQGNNTNQPIAIAGQASSKDANVLARYAQPTEQNGVVTVQSANQSKAPEVQSALSVIARPQQGQSQSSLQQQNNTAAISNATLTTVSGASADAVVSTDTHLGGYNNPLFQQQGGGGTPQTLIHLQASGEIASTEVKIADTASHRITDNTTLDGATAGANTLTDNIGKHLMQKASSGEFVPPSEQVSVHVSQAVKEGKSSINIHLEPSALGKVDVKLDFTHDGKTSVLIVAEKAETLDMLQRDARHLEKALNDAGIKTDSGSLSFNLQGGNAQQQQQYAEHSPRYTSTQVVVEDESVAPQQVLQAYSQDNYQGGVDLRV